MPKVKLHIQGHGPEKWEENLSPGLPPKPMGFFLHLLPGSVLHSESDLRESPVLKLP